MKRTVPPTGDEKESLHVGLDQHRDVVLWKLDGVGEEQLRRPMTPSGTNLSGLVKHLASVEYSWFCETFGRETEPLPFDDDNEDADLRVEPHESSATTPAKPSSMRLVVSRFRAKPGNPHALGPGAVTRATGNCRHAGRGCLVDSRGAGARPGSKTVEKHSVRKGSDPCVPCSSRRDRAAPRTKDAPVERSPSWCDPDDETPALLVGLLLDDKFTRDGLLILWRGRDLERFLVEVVPRRLSPRSGWSTVPECCTGGWAS